MLDQMKQIHQNIASVSEREPSNSYPSRVLNSQVSEGEDFLKPPESLAARKRMSKQIESLDDNFISY